MGIVSIEPNKTCMLLHPMYSRYTFHILSFLDNLLEGLVLPHLSCVHQRACKFDRKYLYPQANRAYPMLMGAIKCLSRAAGGHF